MGRKRLRNIPKMSQLVSGKAGISTGWDTAIGTTENYSSEQRPNQAYRRFSANSFQLTPNLIFKYVHFWDPEPKGVVGASG